MVEVGKTYNCFDDGKIKESRRYEVTITEIIPFADIDFKTLAQWNSEAKNYPQLYAEETDFFIKGSIRIDEDVDNAIVEDTFVRTKDGGWFGLHFFYAGKHCFVLRGYRRIKFCAGR